MNYKTGKLISIVKQWLGNGTDKFEINGADLARAVFLYRTKTTPFEPIPKGNYRILTESNNMFLKVDEQIKNKAYEYQIIYDDTLKGSTYDEDFPELSVLVNKYNTLVKDTKIIEQYLKTNGIKADTNSMTQVLTPLEPNSFWATNNEGILEGLPIGDRNTKYELMLKGLRADTENLIRGELTTSLQGIRDLRVEEEEKIKKYKEDAIIKFTEKKQETENYISTHKTQAEKYIDNVKLITENQIDTKRNEVIKEIQAQQNRTTKTLEGLVDSNINVIRDWVNNANNRYGEITSSLNKNLESLQENINVEKRNLKAYINNYVADNHEQIRGPQGIQGPQGLQGPQGIPGEKGEQGLRGQGITSVVALDNNRVKMLYGDSQETIVSIPTIQGPKGEQGLPGERGLQGPPGQKGERGERGLQGNGITNIELNSNGQIIFTCDNGENKTINLPNIASGNSISAIKTLFSGRVDLKRLKTMNSQPSWVTLPEKWRVVFVGIYHQVSFNLDPVKTHITVRGTQPFLREGFDGSEKENYVNVIKLYNDYTTSLEVSLLPTDENYNKIVVKIRKDADDYGAWPVLYYLGVIEDAEL